ncbi:MAG: GTPase, partial [Thermoguttaceae bacterium]
QVEQLALRMTARRQSGRALNAVLVGPPNAGKSSLFNALAADAGAIVSDLPGTTRDYLGADLDLDGVPCRLTDTAGISPGPCARDVLDQAAQEVARQLADEADLLILCHEAACCRPTPVPPPWGRKDVPFIVVRTKADLAETIDDGPASIATSIRTGDGIRELEARIRQAAVEASFGDGDGVVGTAVRCGQSLRHAAAALLRAESLAAGREGDELVASELRTALDAIGRVVGAVYTDELLDGIFARFCVGK